MEAACDRRSGRKAGRVGSSLRRRGRKRLPKQAQRIPSALEWPNLRLGETIKEVRLKAASGFRNTKGEITPQNPPLLNALSLVRKRTLSTSAGRLR